jgi:gag-polypeptide of LTR copia-type
MEYKIESSAFNGKPEDWNKWSKKFIARASLMGCKNVLLGIEEMPEDKSETEFEDFVMKNDIAFADLMMTCEEDVHFDLVENARTEELPDGVSRLAWEELKTKYEPSSTMTLISVKKQFALCALSDASLDPDKGIRDLERMRRRLKNIGHFVCDIDLIIHVINNLPDDYENLLRILKER